MSHRMWLGTTRRKLLQGEEMDTNEAKGRAKVKEDESLSIYLPPPETESRDDTSKIDLSINEGREAKSSQTIAKNKKIHSDDEREEVMVPLPDGDPVPQQLADVERVLVEGSNTDGQADREQGAKRNLRIGQGEGESEKEEEDVEIQDAPAAAAKDPKQKDEEGTTADNEEETQLPKDFPPPQGGDDNLTVEKWAEVGLPEKEDVASESAKISAALKNMHAKEEKEEEGGGDFLAPPPGAESAAAPGGEEWSAGKHPFDQRMVEEYMSHGGDNDMKFYHQQLPRNQGPFYNQYATTVSFVLLLHVLFLHQWNKRTKHRDVAVSYRTLVLQKHFHKAIGAILSHPPAATDGESAGEGGSSTGGSARSLGSRRNGGSSRTVDMGSDDFNPPPRSRLQRLFHRIRYYRSLLLQYFQPIISGHLSGLPLLIYNAHILWMCRALEQFYDSSSSFHSKRIYAYSYPRTLLGLALTSLAMEMYISYRLLQVSRSLIFFTSSGFATRPEDNHRIIRDRGVCTTTSLTAAVLVVYRNHFPHVPLDPLPFVSLGGGMHPTLAYGFCLTLLLLLSYRSHPVSGVLYGSVAGTFWSAGLTSVLAERYWGSGLVAALLLGCCLSIRAVSGGGGGRGASSRLGGASAGGWWLAEWIPFVDYVGWDGRGQLLDERGMGMAGRTRDGEEEGDEEGGEVAQTQSDGSAATAAAAASTEHARNRSSRLEEDGRVDEETIPFLQRTGGVGGSDDPLEREQQQQRTVLPTPSRARDDVGIRGRVPLMAMDSGLEDGGGGGESSQELGGGSGGRGSSGFGMSRRGGGGVDGDGFGSSSSGR